MKKISDEGLSDFQKLLLVILLSLIMFAVSSCTKQDFYDRDECLYLLDKQATMLEIADWSYQDSVNIYTSMEWKSNNHEILSHCRYYAQINELTK